jgi:hypothetical protein
MQAGNSNLFQPYLIWLSGSHRKVGGRKLLCDGFLYNLFFSPCPRIKNVIPSPPAKVMLSATIREAFTVNRDRAGMDPLRLAQSS